MNLNGLNFDSIPPFEVPSRFFLTAPLFGLLAAFIIGWSGSELWLSRWHPATLALTHAIVLGLISTMMCGAIFQLLPVLGGITLPRVKVVATAVLIGLSGGTLLLVAGFYFSQSLLFYPALLLLSMVLILFIITILRQLTRHHTASQSIQTMRFGFISMLMVVILAAVMLADHLIGTSYNSNKLLTDHHAAWGLIGWVSLVIIGVSFQVLPMFHVAPAFPRWSTRWLPLALVTTLGLNSGFYLINHANIGYGHGQFLLTQLIKIILIIYGITALRLLVLRKRKIFDISVICWQIALACLIISCLLSLTATAFDAISIPPLIIAALFIFGWIISVIMAMIVKIMPFLAYLHLQQLCGCNFEAFSLLPNVHQLLSKLQMNRLLGCHVGSLVMLLVTLAAPQYYYGLALSLAVQFSYLLWLLWKVNYKYHQIKTSIENTLVNSEPASSV